MVTGDILLGRAVCQLSLFKEMLHYISYDYIGPYVIILSIFIKINEMHENIADRPK